MVKKDRKWEWAEKQEKVFEELKKRFMQELVSTAPDLDKRMRMKVNVKFINSRLSVSLFYFLFLFLFRFIFLFSIFRTTRVREDQSC